MSRVGLRSTRGVTWHEGPTVRIGRDPGVGGLRVPETSDLHLTLVAQGDGSWWVHATAPTALGASRTGPWRDVSPRAGCVVAPGAWLRLGQDRDTAPVVGLVAAPGLGAPTAPRPTRRPGPRRSGWLAAVPAAALAWIAPAPPDPPVPFLGTGPFAARVEAAARARARDHDRIARDHHAAPAIRHALDRLDARELPAWWGAPPELGACDGPAPHDLIDHTEAWLDALDGLRRGHASDDDLAPLVRWAGQRANAHGDAARATAVWLAAHPGRPVHELLDGWARCARATCAPSGAATVVDTLVAHLAAQVVQRCVVGRPLPDPPGCHTLPLPAPEAVGLAEAPCR